MLMKGILYTSKGRGILSLGTYFGGVYKISGRKYGLILLPDGCHKKLDYCDSELIWGELTHDIQERVTWQVVFLPRVKSTGLNVVKRFILFCWKSLIQICTSIYLPWQWMLISSLSETSQISCPPWWREGKAGARAGASGALALWFSVRPGDIPLSLRIPESLPEEPGISECDPMPGILWQPGLSHSVPSVSRSMIVGIPCLQLPIIKPIFN